MRRKAALRLSSSSFAFKEVGSVKRKNKEVVDACAPFLLPLWLLTCLALSPSAILFSFGFLRASGGRSLAQGNALPHTIDAPCNKGGTSQGMTMLMVEAARQLGRYGYGFVFFFLARDKTRTRPQKITRNSPAAVKR